MEQLELDFGTPDPLPNVTYFDPVLGPIQGPPDLHGA